MAGRPIFKAEIGLSKLSVPVKFYAAVRKERVRFRLLHDKDRQPLEQKLYCAREDKPVAPDEQVRGYEVTRGQYVVLDPEAIKAIQPQTDRRIEVLHFVRESEIDPRLLDRPYYLGEDGHKTDYALLARALHESGRVAVCRWTMRRKQYLGMLKALDKLLLMVTLRFAHQLVPAGELAIKHPKVKQKELKTARDLIEELSEDFDPQDYQNDYQQRLMHFIEQKAKGNKPKMEQPKRKKPTTPGELQVTLERSLKQARAG